ncbi:hypothetical protein CEXT_281571, partial [Caerostris extrusa]
ATLPYHVKGLLNTENVYNIDESYLMWYLQLGEDAADFVNFIRLSLQDFAVMTKSFFSLLLSKCHLYDGDSFEQTETANRPLFAACGIVHKNISYYSLVEEYLEFCKSGGTEFSRLQFDEFEILQSVEIHYPDYKCYFMHDLACEPQ